MTQDTQALNRARNLLGDQAQIWLFGYGSLIYKVDFPYLERRPASIKNWTRRFWQGSHDHRGTPQAPGRVATLVEQPGASCKGMAYLISPAVFEHLDHREKNGYLRFTTRMTFDSGEHAEGLVYIATEENEAFLGPDTDQAIAAHILQSAGPSGPNDEYLLKLEASLRDLNADDPHVFALAKELKRLRAHKGDQ